LLVADIYPQDHALTLDWLEAQTPALVAKKLKHLPPVEPFRTHPEPNDLMYIVAIHVLESITQSSWKDQLAENVLTPLGLKNTGAHFTNLSRKDNVAKGYSYDALEGHGRNIPVQDLEPLYSPYTATKGMYSTLHDLAEWTKSLMFVDCDGSDRERVPLISRETLSNYIFAGHSVLSSSREPHFSTPLQGLGWIVNTYKGNDVCSHSSEFAGITTTCIIAPSKGCSVVLLTNQQESPISRSLPWFAMDLVLNEGLTCHRTTFRNWVADLAKSQIAEAHSKNALATTDGLNIDSDLDYVGTYHHDWCGVAHVERQTFAIGNPNALRMRLGLLEGNLRPSSVVGYIWELDGNAPKVLGYKTPCLYSVRLLHDRFQTSCDGRYLSLTRMELRTLKPIDKPIYFNRKLDDIN
jgi:CubicO group peptidase (beta-lactamase class C family)